MLKVRKKAMLVKCSFHGKTCAANKELVNCTYQKAIYLYIC